MVICLLGAFFSNIFKEFLIQKVWLVSRSFVVSHTPLISGTLSNMKQLLTTGILAGDGYGSLEVADIKILKIYENIQCGRLAIT